MGLIQSSRIGIYANEININGTIDASGCGCQAGEGLGKGLSSSSKNNCTASGASHGGSGGVAVNYYTRQL